MSKMRIEKDSLGEIAVPEKALYGAQTQRAINNFPVSGRPMPEAFIRAVIHIKRAAAEANAELNCIEQSIAEAITAVCDNLLSCEDGFMEHFPVDIFQTGSGTSMNVNEVIANLANLEGEMTIHPNDHVNFGQSSNDVIPTAIHVCNAIHIEQDVLPALAHLSATLKAKANLLRTICKTGRTHLMDAMPVRFDQTLHAWAAQVEANYERLSGFRTTIQTLPQGGTAVGTGINTHPDFAAVFNRQLGKAFGLSFSSAENPASLTSGQETAVVLSGLYKATGITLMKIAKFN